MSKPRILIAADHGGFALKEILRTELGAEYEVVDLGCFNEEAVDYPDYAATLCRQLLEEGAVDSDADCTAGNTTKGILVCGTGIGMCIAANKITGIRAALCHDTFSARATREHNDSNVLCLGARVIGSGVALEIVRIWLSGVFTGGRHQRRVDKISALEKYL